MNIPLSSELVSKIKQLGPSGFRVARHALITEPDNDLIEGMPASWLEVYIREGYAVGDPVLLWSLVSEGTKRWSEIEIDDYKGVLEHAKAFGLVYGVVVSRIIEGRHSILSVARSDREYEDEELSLCEALLDDALREKAAKVSLSEAEQEVLQLLAAGRSLNAIAIEKGVAISTVKLRLGRAKKKLSAKTATQAVVTAARRHLL